MYIITVPFNSIVLNLNVFNKVAYPCLTCLVFTTVVIAPALQGNYVCLFLILILFFCLFCFCLFVVDLK